jgi:hypothetical protein
MHQADNGLRVNLRLPSLGIDGYPVLRFPSEFNVFDGVLLDLDSRLKIITEAIIQER